MKDRTNTRHGSTRQTRRMAGRSTALCLALLLPLLMGGCPEFRNDLVDLVESATRSALLSTQDPIAIADTATLSLVDAVLGLFFGQLRADPFQTN